MKLMLPVAGMVIAAGSCCCCCGDLFGELPDEVTGLVDEAKRAAEEATGGAAVAVGEGTATMEAGTAAAGACGRFQTLGVPAPSGFSITACSDMAGTGGLVMRGAGAAADACASMKAWADTTGYSPLANSTMGDTVAMTYQKGSEFLAISCTNAGGEAQISVGLTQM